MSWIITIFVSALCGFLAAFIYGKIANRQKPKKNCRKNGACACKNGIGECSSAGWVSARCRYYNPKAEDGET
jgi:hypothetical protein